MKIKSVQTAIKRISILISLLVLSQACNPSGGAKKKDNTLLYGALAVSVAQANTPSITSFTFTEELEQQLLSQERTLALLQK